MMNRAALLLTSLLALAFTFSCHASGSSSSAGDARLKRGEYLVEHVALCTYCHSEIDWAKTGYPPMKGYRGSGQAPFMDASVPFINVPNISSDRETGIGAWTDAEVKRAIRQGVSRDGRRLFPVMPYLFFHQMSDADLDAVVAYVRTFPPVKRKITPSKLPPPLAEMLKGMPPVPAESMPEPDRSSPGKYGKYLATLASCVDCHTPMNPDGSRPPGMEFGGGMLLSGPWGKVVSPNLTPDPSGIPHYNAHMFAQVLTTGNVGGRKLNAIMPWGYYHALEEADLKAIFAFLKTLKPVRHRVDNTTPPTPCKVCGQKHGLGDLNR